MHRLGRRFAACLLTASLLVGSTAAPWLHLHGHSHGEACVENGQSPHEHAHAHRHGHSHARHHGHAPDHHAHDHVERDATELASSAPGCPSHRHEHSDDCATCRFEASAWLTPHVVTLEGVAEPLGELPPERWSAPSRALVAIPQPRGPPSHV